MARLGTNAILQRIHRFLLPPVQLLFVSHIRACQPPFTNSLEPFGTLVHLSALNFRLDVATPSHGKENQRNHGKHQPYALDDGPW